MQVEGKMGDEDIRKKVETFMFEGHDTSGIAFTIWWIGQYPEYQRKVHEEIDEVFGEDTERLPTNEDIKKLEALRLFRSVPLIARKLTEDLVLPHPVHKSFTLPKGNVAALLGSARDPREYERPEEFYPDNFDIERVARRNAYSYVSFSAGPQNCIAMVRNLRLLRRRPCCLGYSVDSRFQVSSIGIQFLN